MKTRLGIIFGGRSDEHEVSILSAASVLTAIDRGKYEVAPFIIDKSGVWRLVENGIEDITELSDPRLSSLASNAVKVSISDFDSMTDFAFPLMHGPYGEDGTIQGLFEMLGKPYAGCGVAASAVTMDKIFTKQIWGKNGLPGCKYTYTTRHACAASADGVATDGVAADGVAADGVAKEAARIENEIPYPIFVKPANTGSSIGVAKVHDLASLKAAMEKAFKYDKRVIAEQAVDGREIEIGVVGNDEPKASVVGEIIPEAEYYDFESKYLSGNTKLDIPADLPDNIRYEVESLATEAYRALDGEGFARVDLFYDEKQGKVYLNEMNTIPGFTRYSMFPLLWQAKGVSFTELIERIIELGYERHNSARNR